jgi:integrative and conjugative element protein (TIGR02256 family)
MTVWLNVEARDAIDRLARRFPHLETGGGVFGWCTEDAIVVVGVSSPGSRARHGRATLELNPRDVRAAAKLVHGATEGRLGFIGTWHTHPGQAAVPSGRDLAAARQLAGDRSLQLPEPLVLIAQTTLGVGDVVARRAWRWKAREGSTVEQDIVLCELPEVVFPEVVAQ